MGESLCQKVMTQINVRKPLLKDYDPNQCEKASVESLYLPNQWEKASVERLSPKSMGESLCQKVMTQINARKPLLKDYDPNQWEKASVERL